MLMSCTYSSCMCLLVILMSFTMEAQNCLTDIRVSHYSTSMGFAHKTILKCNLILKTKLYSHQVCQNLKVKASEIKLTCGIHWTLQQLEMVQMTPKLCASNRPGRNGQDGWPERCTPVHPLSAAMECQTRLHSELAPVKACQKKMHKMIYTINNKIKTVKQSAQSNIVK